MSAPPRRILHLIDTGGPGGAETVFLQLVRRLPKERWASIAVVPWADDWLHARLVEEGADAVVLASRGSFDLGYLRRLAGLARASGADLVHAHLPTTAVYGSLVGRALGLPTVSTFHGPADLPPDLRYEYLKMRLLDRPDGRVVLVSDRLRDWFLRRTGFPPGRTRVVPNGIDRQRYRSVEGGARLRDTLCPGSNGLIVGALGNIRASKDYGTLLRAAAAVLDACRIPVWFVVAGHGDADLENELARIHEELELGNRFRFLGFEPDPARFLSALDIYVLSSSDEGFSLSTVEAMASGLPVVATRCGGPEDIVDHGRTGILVRSRDPGQLARALLELIGNPAERERLGRSARAAVADRFSVEAMIRGYEDVYADVLEGK